MKKYNNWNGNIISDIKIETPEKNEYIIDIIRKCKEERKKVRVVGSGHTMAPFIAHNKESDIFLISLEKYDLEPSNFVLDKDKMEVTVNAGMKLSELYNELSKYRLFLDTQPASTVFTVGGLINMPVHGGRLGASILSDSVKSLSFIDDNGIINNVKEGDKNFNLYRMGLGMFGIIISVTFKVYKIESLTVIRNTANNLFYLDKNKYKLDRKLVHNRFCSIVKKCIDNNELKQYHHSFMDFHNNKLLSIDWTESKNPSHFMNIKEATKIIDFPPNDFVNKTLLPNYRTYPFYLKTMGSLARNAIKLFVDLNQLDDQDMFWFFMSSKVYYLGYFIPIYTEGDDLEDINALNNLYKSLETVMNKVHYSINNKKSFNIDLPMDIRFVVSNNSCPLSPIYKKGKKVVYAAVDLITGASNINLNYQQKQGSYKKLNKHFRQFYSNVENEWKKLGGVPHYAKMFGFAPPTKYNQNGKKSYPFTYVNDLFQFIEKEEIAYKSSSIFRSDFIENLLY